MKLSLIRSGLDTYGIRCFIDMNGDEKINIEIFRPTEPWGMSWQRKKPFGWPKWKDWSFDLRQDLTRLRIIVE